MWWKLLGNDFKADFSFLLHFLTADSLLSTQDSVKMLEFECFLVFFSILLLTEGGKVFYELVWGTKTHFTNSDLQESQRIALLQIVLSKFLNPYQILNYPTLVLGDTENWLP